MFLLVSSNSYDTMEIVFIVIVLLFLSVSLVWDIYKEKKKSLDCQLNVGYISDTEYKKEIKRLRIYSILGGLIVPFLIILIVYLLGFLVFLLVFLTSVVLKKSKRLITFQIKAYGENWNYSLGNHLLDDLFRRYAVVVSLFLISTTRHRDI